MTDKDLIIVPMAEADLTAVVEIEGATLSAWNRLDFTDEFDQPGAVQFVAKTPATGAILGHICARTGADEAEIMKLSVREDKRRQGVGESLLNHLLDFLRNRKTTHCYLELRASNQAALSLYKKSGFVESGFRKKYYSSPEEPAILMTKPL